MNGMLSGKVAIITGAASGIGRATALQLAREGAAVVVADLRPEPREGGEPTAQLIVAEGGTASFIHCDVTNRDHRQAVVARAEQLGGVDLLVNNAGLFRAQDFLETSEAEYDRMSDVNVKAVYFMSQAAARFMVPRGSGCIINLSSVAGLQGVAGFSTYCLTKGAVRLMTYALADELGPHGIRVNAVHPGFIDTSMTRIDVPVVDTPMAAAYLESIPLRRAGSAQDVARSILLLASDLAGYVSGASLNVDGGRMRF